MKKSHLASNKVGIQMEANKKNLKYLCDNFRDGTYTSFLKSCLLGKRPVTFEVMEYLTSVFNCRQEDILRDGDPLVASEEKINLSVTPKELKIILDSISVAENEEIYDWGGEEVHILESLYDRLASVADENGVEYV